MDDSSTGVRCASSLWTSENSVPKRFVHHPSKQQLDVVHILLLEINILRQADDEMLAVKMHLDNPNFPAGESVHKDL